MFAQTLESVNVSFTEFGYFQPLFQYFSAHFSPVTWMLTLDYRPAGPWDSVHFSFAVYFSLCHSDWVVSICLSSAFFCLHHSAEPISWFLYFGNCIFQFWDFLLGWAPPPPFFFFKPRHSSGKEESSSCLPNLLLTPPWWGCWDAWLYLGERRCLIYPGSLLAWVGMWPQVFSLWYCG